jgi:hypothetical protein
MRRASRPADARAGRRGGVRANRRSERPTEAAMHTQRPDVQVRPDAVPNRMHKVTNTRHRRCAQKPPTGSSQRVDVCQASPLAADGHRPATGGARRPKLPMIARSEASNSRFAGLRAALHRLARSAHTGVRAANPRPRSRRSRQVDRGTSRRRDHRPATDRTRHLLLAQRPQPHSGRGMAHWSAAAAGAGG